MAGDNRLVTEYFLSQNFTPKSGVTPGSNNLISMDCDQIKARYNVDVAGTSSTGLRLPGQNQLSVATSAVLIDTYSEVDYLSTPATTMSITLPSTVASGKLIVLWVLLNTDASISIPSGFSYFGHTAGVNYKSYAIYYKPTAGNEGGNSLSVDIGSSSYGTIGYAIFNGVKTSSPYVTTGDSYKTAYGTEINFNYADVGYDGAMNIIITNTNLTASGTVGHTAGYTVIGGYNRGNTNIPTVVIKEQSGNVWDDYSKTSSVNGYHNGLRLQILPN